MAIQRSRRRSRLVLIIAGFSAVVFGACSATGGNPAAVSGPEQVKAIFNARCGICHGPDGKLQYNNATDLSTSILSRGEVITRILEGKNTMPPFRELLSAEQIEWIADYTMTLRSGGE
jgi:cytochrome c6